jgi:putative two-component system response regulator
MAPAKARIKELLRTRSQLYYELVDRQGRVLPSHGAFWQYLGKPLPAGPVPLGEALPELFGVERELEALMQAASGSFELPAIQRSGSGRETGPGHFDLTLLATGDPAEPLLLVLEDRTRHLEMQRQLLQSRNDVLLLKKQVEEKNAALAAMSETIRQHNHELERQVRLRTRELRDSRLEIVRRLGLAAEYRDGHTGGHIFRISRSCALIAQHCGLDEAVCELLLHATPMHDVGKIAIADSILLKPGKLDSTEWSIMQRHTHHGAELLSGSDFEILQAARDIAYCHHEWWDGSGYPRRLRGEQIPLAARICAIADVFDALTSDRPYKVAWSAQAAVETIRRQAGSQFDPRVVEAFLQVLDDILKLKHQYQDAQFLRDSFVPEL